MKDSEKNSFSALPVSLVNEILEKSGQIAREIYEPFREIKNNREKMREQLHENNIIQNDSIPEGREIFTSCGIDGYCAIENFQTSDLVCCSAFAEEGMVPPSGERHLNEPSHKALFHTEKKHSETAKILQALMMELEIELAAGAPHKVIMLNRSFITSFITIMEAGKLASDLKESTTAKEFMERIENSLNSLKIMCDSQNTRQMYVCIPQNKYRRELIEKLGLSVDLDDNTLFTILLLPGEYTAPVPVEQSEISMASGLSHADEKIKAIRDELASALGQLHVFYYRPYEWTPVFRMEIFPSVAANSTQIALLLNSIKFQCSTAGIPVPFPVYRAGKMVENMKRAIPSIRRLTTSQIINITEGDTGELLTLLMFKS